MTKIKLNKGLNLNKKSITKLQETQLPNFIGGGVGIGGTGSSTVQPSCPHYSCIKSCPNESCVRY